jgi:hypothetical protein
MLNGAAGWSKLPQTVPQENKIKISHFTYVIVMGRKKADQQTVGL